MGETKILIVEDEKDSLEYIGHYLEKNGFKVFLAADGQEAYDMVRKVLPDIVITDIIMPKIDGHQLIRKIRDTHYGKKIGIIVMTVRRNMYDYFKAIGVDDFISKPFTPQQILASVKNVLKNSQEVPLPKMVRRVLVAGSHELEVEKIAGQLREENCHVDLVTYGEQVISKAVMFLPHVIILEAEIYDIHPPELVSILRQMPQFKKTPIIIYRRSKMDNLFNHHDQEEDVRVGVLVERCLEKGASVFIGHYDDKTFKDQIGRYISTGAVVLIDDDEGVVRLIKTKVENLGYKFFAASDGYSGLDLVRKINPNLVLLDVVMPGMEGYDVLDIIRHDPDLHKIPVIMVTIRGKDEEVQRGLALGADDYVIKPVCMNLLLKKIESFVAAN